MSYRKDRDEFVHLMTKEGVSLMDIERVLRQAIRYQRLQVAQCERNVTQVEVRQEQAIERDLTERLQPYGVTPVFGGDPRGATVKLKVPSGKTNDWGQVGICVPTTFR